MNTDINKYKRNKRFFSPFYERECGVADNALEIPCSIPGRTENFHTFIAPLKKQ